jgi:hypothetical protein
VPLGQLLGEEKLDPIAVAVIAPPEVAVAHRPVRRVDDLLLPTALGLDGVVMPRRHRDAGRDRDEPDDGVGMICGEPQRPRRRVTVGDDDRLGHTGGGEHGDQVGDDLVGSVARALMRPVGAAGAPPVGGDDGEVARQGRDQPLPRPGVGDR